MLEEQCSKIKILVRKHDTFNLHKKVKEAAGLYRHRTDGCLTNDDGKTIIVKQTKINTWKQNIQNLFDHGNRGNIILIAPESKLSTTEEKTRTAIK